MKWKSDGKSFETRNWVYIQAGGLALRRSKDGSRIELVTRGVQKELPSDQQKLSMFFANRRAQGHVAAFEGE